MNAGSASFISKCGFAVAMLATSLATPTVSHAAEGDWTSWLGAGGLFLEADDENESGGLYEARMEYQLDDVMSLEGGLGGVPFAEGNSFNAPHPREATFSGVNSPGENWLIKANLGVLYSLKSDPDSQWDPYLSMIVGSATWGKYRDGTQWSPFGGPGFGVKYWVDKDLGLRLDYNVVAANQDNIDINHHVLAMVHYNWGGEGREGEGDGQGDNELGRGSTGPLKTIYFDFDKSSITSQSAQTLKENSEWMKANSGKHVSIEGHCDERGTNEYNMALGARRAKSAYDYLRNLGIPSEQMSTQSFGEEFPADPGHNEAAWSKNRRAESVVGKK